MPYNRLVDEANPESEIGRRFQELVQKYMQSNFQDHDAEAQLRTLFASWRDNDAKLHPLLENSFLLQENVPLSSELSATGTIGLSALDYLAQSRTSAESWRSAQLAQLGPAMAPTANLLLTVVEPVRRLVEATAAPGQHP